MRSSKGAFTLLEVMAAVAILALSYTTLASSGIIGLQREGEARRRIEASLVADAELAEIETQLEAGISPPLDENEHEADGFTISIAVTPFVIDIPEEDTDSGQRLGRARSRLRGSEAQTAEPVIPGPSLLGGGGPGGAASPLRRIDVRVVWNEGFDERTVSRTTFALDLEAAGPTIDAIGQAQAAAAGAAQARPDTPNPLGGGDRGTIGTGQ